MASKDKKSTKVSPDQISSYNLGAQYRPHNLDDFVGQDEALNVVRGWIKQKRFPQTILIHGQTGSGKTTLAKILARVVNCATMDACGKCSYCKHDDTNLPDVLEINAGTHGKVEDIDAILRAAKQSPRFRRRIILVDESHLLTDKAESNLLIPTETPHPHTMWIFCTTDPEKMKSTMKNRCTQLAIRPVPEDVIAKRLLQICKAENVVVKDKDAAKAALKVIASMSEGQMRFALSQLDALLSVVASGKKFNEDSVMEISNSVMNTDLDKIAAQCLVGLLRNNLDNVILMVMKANNPRTLITRIRYLIDWIIQYHLKLVPYVPAVGKIWQSLCNQQEKSGKPVEYNTAGLIKIQNAMLEVDYKILNTPAFPANIALYTALGNLTVDDYFLNVLGKKKSKG